MRHGFQILQRLEQSKVHNLLRVPGRTYLTAWATHNPEFDEHYGWRVDLRPGNVSKWEDEGSNLARLGVHDEADPFDTMDVYLSNTPVKGKKLDVVNYAVELPKETEGAITRSMARFLIRQETS